MAQQTTLITGASSGIGMELAREFAQHGHSIVLVARGVDKLEELAHELRSKHNVRAEVIGADLTQPNAPEQIVKTLAERNLTIDVLVNNAGFGERGAFAQIDTQRQLDMIQVNITAVAHLTRLLLPGMIQRNAGGILNVASTAAFQGGPNMAMYYATKAFVLSFTEALHEEVTGTNLHVTCRCPGRRIPGLWQPRIWKALTYLRWARRRLKRWRKSATRLSRTIRLSPFPISRIN